MVVMTDDDLLLIAQLLEDGELGTCHVGAPFLICRAWGECTIFAPQSRVDLDWSRLHRPISCRFRESGHFMFLTTKPGGTLVTRAKSSEVKYQKGSAVVTRPTETESLLTPAEVAAMFRVDPKTVTRWAKAGKLSAIRTLGGHRRYRESEVKELLGDVIPAQRTARD
jgi:excisionase family DNA binding protein